MSENKSPLVSVIVPVYNAERYLHKCIDSILSQTMSDFELLLVDDGSNDASGNICDDYAEKDARVRVFHKANGGVSSARNTGLDNAAGEWVTFCDADDWVGNVHLIHMLSHADDRTDIVISYATICDKDGMYKESYPEYKLDKNSFERLFTESDMHWHTSPWAKLYRKKIIEQHNIRFKLGMHIGEDAAFLFSFLLITNRAFVSTATDYFYRCDISGSLTKRINTVDSEFLSYETIRTLIRLMTKKYHIEDKKAIDNLGWLVSSYVRRVLNALYHNNTDKKTRLRLIKEMDLCTYIKHSNYAQWKEQTGRLLLSLHAFRLYDMSRQFYSKRFKCNTQQS